MQRKRDRLFSVHVGNLPTSVTKRELLSLFNGCGNVIEIHVQSVRHGDTFTFGFVRYASEKEAKRAVEDMDKWPMNGRPMTVSWAKDQPNRHSRPGSASVASSSETSVPTERQQQDVKYWSNFRAVTSKYNKKLKQNGERPVELKSLMKEVLRYESLIHPRVTNVGPPIMLATNLLQGTPGRKDPISEVTNRTVTSQVASAGYRREQTSGIKNQDYLPNPTHISFDKDLQSAEKPKSDTTNTHLFGCVSAKVDIADLPYSTNVQNSSVSHSNNNTAEGTHFSSLEYTNSANEASQYVYDDNIADISEPFDTDSEPETNLDTYHQPVGELSTKIEQGDTTIVHKASGGITPGKAIEPVDTMAIQTKYQLRPPLANRDAPNKGGFITMEHVKSERSREVDPSYEEDTTEMKDLIDLNVDLGVESNKIGTEIKDLIDFSDDSAVEKNIGATGIKDLIDFTVESTVGSNKSKVASSSVSKGLESLRGNNQNNIVKKTCNTGQINQDSNISINTNNEKYPNDIVSNGATSGKEATSSNYHEHSVIQPLRKLNIKFNNKNYSDSDSDGLNSPTESSSTDFDEYLKNHPIMSKSKPPSLMQSGQSKDATTGKGVMTNPKEDPNSSIAMPSPTYENQKNKSPQITSKQKFNNSIVAESKSIDENNSMDSFKNETNIGITPNKDKGQDLQPPPRTSSKECSPETNILDILDKSPLSRALKKKKARKREENIYVS